MKIILGLVVLIVLVVGGAAVALLTIDPNSYKGQISSAVKEATGRDFSISGDINVLFYPVLGFNVAGLEMGSPAGFSDGFVKASEAQAGVKLIPLLQRKIEITTIRLVEPQITIVKAADGKTNLEFPKKEDVAKAETRKLDISVDGIEVSKAKVTYIDKVTGKTTIIDALNLKMPGYAAGRDIDVSFDMVLNNPAPAKPMKLDVHATMKADPDKGRFSFRKLKSNVDLGGAVATVMADVDLNTKAQEIKVAGLEAIWQGTNLKGKADIKGFAKPSVTFDLSSPSVDLDALKPKATGAPSNKPLLPVALLRTLTLDGQINIASLKAAGLDFTNLKTKISAQNGILKADPLTLNMYDGVLTSQLQIDARNATPAFILSGGLKDVEVGKFLTAKMGQDYLTGIANVNFDLNARGNSMNALNKSAGGPVVFDFGKGYINKWQLSKLMNQAITYFETGQVDPNASDKIYFTSLQGTFTGRNGVFSNDNLQMIAPKSHALGAGSVNLGSQSVDYTVRVGGGDNPEKFAKKKHVPIRIVGPLKKPSYKLDMQALIQDLAGEKIEEKKQELMEGLFKKLDKKKGKTETSPVEAPAPEVAPEAATETTPESATPVAPEAAPAEEEKIDPLKMLLQGL